MPSKKRKALAKCPSCGSSKVLPIVYGLPSLDLMRDVERGRVALGGCCISDNDPEWRCADCGHEWGRR